MTSERYRGSEVYVRDSDPSRQFGVWPAAEDTFWGQATEPFTFTLSFIHHLYHL
jgi:hypothetical protein